LFKDSCLKFRQKIFLLPVMALLFTSCGQTAPWKTSTSSLMLSEYSCAPASTLELATSKNIAALFFEQRIKNPAGFFFIEPRIYDYENPLILSEARMQQDYVSLKNDRSLEQRSADLFFLYNFNQRFESQRCQFGALAEKKKYDLRPYLSITHQCYKKYNNTSCDNSEYENMTPEKESWTKNNALDLCNSLSAPVSCIKEYKFNKMNNTLGDMIRKYQSRFETERYQALFKLRPSHNKYNCSREGERLIMQLKIYSPSIEAWYLRELLNEVEASWQNTQFALKVELVDHPVKDAIKILPTTRAVSYVPDDNNRIVYLSRSQDLQTSKRILAHEFGHVLGFPDCYIEFFDDKKKELVYYEISKNYNNIMCSLKNGVRVPEDYFVQLEQNSCIFN